MHLLHGVVCISLLEWCFPILVLFFNSLIQVLFALVLANKTSVLYQLNWLSVVEFHVEDGMSVHSSLGHPLLFGAASYRAASVALKLRKTSNKKREIISNWFFSINQLNSMCRNVTKVSFLYAHWAAPTRRTYRVCLARCCELSPVECRCYKHFGFLHNSQVVPNGDYVILVVNTAQFFLLMHCTYIAKAK
jgi:hypothetical protein